MKKKTRNVQNAPKLQTFVCLPDQTPSGCLFNTWKPSPTVEISTLHLNATPFTSPSYFFVYCSKKKIISNDFQTEIVVRGSCLNRLYKFEFWAFVLNEKLNCFNGNWYLNELVVPIQLQLQFTMIYCFRSKKAGRIISSWTCYECDAVVLTAANLTVTDNQLGGDMHSGWVHLSNFTCMTTSFWKSAYIMERVTCHIWIVILSIYLVCFVFVFLQWFSEQIVHEPIKPLG